MAFWLLVPGLRMGGGSSANSPAVRWIGSYAGKASSEGTYAVAETEKVYAGKASSELTFAGKMIR